MKNIKIIYLLGLILLISSCKKDHIRGDRGKILFQKDKIIMGPSIDTIEINADKGFYMHHIVNSLDLDSNDVFAPNSTRDTIITPWIKAISLGNDEYTLKIITLNRNNSGDNKYCLIYVSNGSYSGRIDITQLSE